jgi:hypothetical protein
MSFDDNVSSRGLAEFLRSNDGNRQELELKEDVNSNFGAWTASQFDRVADAAKRNTSVRAFSMDVANLDSNCVGIAETISSVLRHVNGMQTIDIHDTDQDDHAPTCVVDPMLHGIMESRSEIKNLRLSAHVSPGAFLAFCERFPDLETLSLQGPSSRVGKCDVSSELATAVAIAARRLLRSVRRISLGCPRMSASTANLLSDLVACTTVKELSITFTDRSEGLLEHVARFCVLTKTLEELEVVFQNRENESYEDFQFDVQSMFDFWSHHSISDSISVMKFVQCDLPHPRVLKKVLKNVEALSLVDAHYSHTLDLLEEVPHLKKFCFTYGNLRRDAWGWDDGYDNFYCSVECLRGHLASNDELERLCKIIERQESSLEDIEIDLVGGYHTDPQLDYDKPYERYRASGRLLRACKGSLTVHFESFPWHSNVDIVEGLKSLRNDLRELRIRFSHCAFKSDHYGKMWSAIRQNDSLTFFEFVVESPLYEVEESSLLAVCDLVESNNTLQTLSLALGGRALNPAVILESIAPVLAAKNRTLRILQLPGADVTDTWPRIREPVLSMLNKNRVLSRLEGCALPWSDPTASEVRRLLKLNWYGRRFLPPHEDPPGPMGLWAPILARIAKDREHDVMRTFLRATVDLFLPNSAPPRRADPSRDDDPARVGSRKRSRSEG